MTRRSGPSSALRPLTLALAALLAGCTHVPSGAPPAGASSAVTLATLTGDAARPAQARWARSELYFAVARLDSTDLVARPAGPGAESGVSEGQWRAFLDAEVTTRFPDGLSVFDVYGQWQNRERPAPSRLASKVIVILHPDTPAQRALLDEIRVAWKAATGHQSVLLVTQPADVSF